MGAEPESRVRRAHDCTPRASIARIAAQGNRPHWRGLGLWTDQLAAALVRIPIRILHRL